MQLARPPTARSPWAIRVDRSNPLAKSIASAISMDSLFDGASGKLYESGRVGTRKVVGALGLGRGFGSTDGAGTSDRVVTGAAGASLKRSYFVLAKINGWGGGNFGRFFEDATGNELFYVSSALGLVYWREFSGGSRTANINNTSAVSNLFGKVAAFSVSFDASAPDNQPELYVNGVRYAFSTFDGTPSGSALATGNICIGNRASDTARNLDGVIYDFIQFDRMLLPIEHAALYANARQLYRRRKVFLTAVAAVQYARPTSDVTTGAWVSSLGGSLAAAIDETIADDADYISTTYGSVCEVALGSLVDPASSAGHKVRYRLAADAGAIIVRLRQGATTIASWTHNPAPTSLTTYEQTLSGAEADSITDYSALKIQFEATE